MREHRNVGAWRTTSNRVRLGIAAILCLASMPAAGAFLPSTETPEFVELRGERPSWLTESIFEKVVALGRQGMAYDLALDAPVVPMPSEVFIRPGVLLLGEVNACTANFVYTDSTHGLLIGTAGHCASVGDTAIAVSHPNLLAAIGTTVASLCCGVGNDWALIDIDPAWEPFTDPTVALVTGPCGTYTGPLPLGPDERIVKHVGHGTGTGTVEFPRVGRLDKVGATSFEVFGQSSPGDSGSPVLLEPSPLQTGAVSLAGPCGSGAALGILTHALSGPLFPVSSCERAGSSGQAGFSQRAESGQDVANCIFYGTLLSIVPATVVDGGPLPIVD